MSDANKTKKDVSLQFKVRKNYRPHTAALRTLKRLRNARKFPCRFCPRIYTAKRDLTSHVSDQHPNVTTEDRPVTRRSNRSSSIAYKKLVKDEFKKCLQPAPSPDSEEVCQKTTTITPHILVTFPVSRISGMLKSHQLIPFNDYSGNDNNRANTIKPEPKTGADEQLMNNMCTNIVGMHLKNNIP